MTKSNPEKMEHSVSIQDSAYDLFGDMLLKKETKEICEEIESEKGTEAETVMTDFFIQNEQKHLQIINHNCRGSKGSLINHIHVYHKIIQIAAVLIVCLALAGGIALAASPYIRIQVMRLLANVTPEYTELSFSIEREMNIPAEWQGMYYPSVVPDKSYVSFLESNEIFSRVTYSTEASQNEWILSFVEYEEPVNMRIDTEGSNHTNSIINGYEVSITEKEGLISLYWNDGQRLLVLHTRDISLSETITYASNILLVK